MPAKGSQVIRACLNCAVLCVCLLGISRGGPIDSIEDAIPRGATLQLSNTEPLLRIPIAWETLRVKPDAVAIEVIWIENPARAPVTLEAYFESALQKWNIGNFTLYPPDRPGTFRSRITAIVAQLAAVEPQPVFLCINLRQQSVRDSHKPDDTIIRLGIAVPRLGGAKAST